MNFFCGDSLLKLCEEIHMPISKAMLLRESDLFERQESAVFHEMFESYQIMKDAIHRALTCKIRTNGGFIGGEAKALFQNISCKNNLLGNLPSKAAAYAMGVLEVNASMGLIVAAPTAGSSGVIPGTLLAVQEEYHFPDEKLVTVLFNAGAIGYLITKNATVAGAEGGCQAEVGSASAMAASALTELMGGTPEQCLNAASSALSNVLGLVCDPVGGLVEVPCQKRNAMGAMNALLCANMALSGIQELIPFDEMLDVIMKVGKCIPESLRETSKGGCAAAPSACVNRGYCPNS